MIDNDYRRAVIAIEVMRPIVFDKDYLSRFDNTRAAHVINFLQTSVMFDGVSSIVRVWDTGSGVRSIPKLLNRLNGDRLQRQIKARRRHVKASHAPATTIDGKPIPEEVMRSFRQSDVERAKKLAESVGGEVAALNSEIDTILAYDELHRLRLVRTEMLAHNIGPLSKERRDREKAGLKIEPPKWGDLAVVARATGQVILGLSMTIQRAGFDPQDLHDVWSQYSSEFWAGMTLSS